MTVERPPKPVEIRSLTAIRGIAALFVFLFHVRFFLPEARDHLVIGPIIESSYIWVDFFFILSGFILTHVYGGRLMGKPQIKKFAIARLARVVPLHWVILIALLGIEFGLRLLSVPAFGETRSLYDFFMSFFLVHGWGFTLVDNWPWNAPSWSISTEIFCYLLFPLFLYLAKKYTPILLVMVLISGFTFMWQYEVIENTYNTPYKFMLIRTVPAFILGVLIYDFHGLFRRLSSSILFVIQSLCLILIFTILITGGSKLWLMPFFAILILSLFHDRGGIASVLSSRPLHGLGVISYAVYMIHYPLLDFWMRFTDFGEDHGGVLAVIGMLSITIILSMLAYRFIENPARKKIRQIGRRLY